jgi:membrane peptidoglycan carboxypeptidase
LLSSEQTFRRKIREVIVAILAEGIYEKDQILEMYLNQVAYGGSTYGIEEAAHRYFGKSAADLDLAESALIAGLPAAPTAYTPFGSNPEFAKTRQIEVLRRMVEDGYISQEQATVAASEQLQYATDTIDIEAPHFVMYVKRIRRRMDRKLYIEAV